MKHRPNRWVGAFIAVLAGVAVLAPAAHAAVTPTLSLDQSAGTKAGSMQTWGST